MLIYLIYSIIIFFFFIIGYIIFQIKKKERITNQQTDNSIYLFSYTNTLSILLILCIFLYFIQLQNGHNIVNTTGSKKIDNDLNDIQKIIDKMNIINKKRLNNLYGLMEITSKPILFKNKPIFINNKQIKHNSLYNYKELKKINYLK